jgi:hypothetical protein
MLDRQTELVRGGFWVIFAFIFIMKPVESSIALREEGKVIFPIPFVRFPLFIPGIFRFGLIKSLAPNKRPTPIRGLIIICHALWTVSVLCEFSIKYFLLGLFEVILFDKQLCIRICTSIL